MNIVKPVKQLEQSSAKRSCAFQNRPVIIVGSSEVLIKATKRLTLKCSEIFICFGPDAEVPIGHVEKHGRCGTIQYKRT